MPNRVETPEFKRIIDQLWLLIRVNPELFTFAEALAPNPIIELMNLRHANNHELSLEEIENKIKLVIKNLLKKTDEKVKYTNNLSAPTLNLPAFDLLKHVHHLGLDLIEQAILETNPDNTDKETRINIRRISQMKQFIRQIGTDIEKLDEEGKGLCAEFSNSAAGMDQLIQQYNSILIALVKLEQANKNVTLAYDAALQSHDQLFNDLLEAGAEVNRAPESEPTAFEIATTYTSIPIVESCLAYFCDTRKTNLQKASLPALEYLYNTYNIRGGDAFNTQFTGSTELINILKHKNNLCIANIKTHLPKLWNHLSKNTYYVSIISNSKPIYSRNASLAASTMNGALTAVIIGTVLKSSGGTVPNMVNMALISAAVAVIVAVATYAYLRRNATPTQTLLLMQAPGKGNMSSATPLTTPSSMQNSRPTV